MANSYDIPSWAGKPPTGLHLDVLKDDKLVQKFMVDEKRCYLFGRNNQMNDFCIDHASCSRVHAAFVYHKHLDFAYLVDLGSTHGTFIGTLRLESHKPTHLQVNSMFHFGASTRRYILRERPSKGQRSNIIEDLPISESCHGTMLGLPESQTELDNLTEYNTAHNRRISMLGITDDNLRKPTTCKHGTRKRRNVTFNEEEIIINPEDVDPNVGRFRNLIQTTIVPAKRIRFEFNQMCISNTPSVKISSNQHQQFYQHTPGLDMKAADTSSLYQGLPAAHDVHSIGTKSNASNNEFDVTPIAMGTKLGLLVPNPAPEVTPDLCQSTTLTSSSISQKLAFVNSNMSSTEERHVPGEIAHPQKKKYAKEAWPGRKPMLGQL